MDYFVGADVGGTQIKTVLINQSGKLIDNFSLPTAKNNRKKIIEDIVESISRVKKGKLKGIGIGLPGILDKSRNKILYLPNAPALERVDLKKIIFDKFKAKVLLENDANCLAWGQRCFYHKDKASLLAVTLGTSVGGGIVLDGKIYHGQQDAGEFGHMVIDVNGYKCHCGRLGCWGQYIAKQGIIRIARKNGLSVSAVHILYNLAKKKNKRAQKVFGIVSSYLAVGLMNLTYILHPEVIVIGGGIAQSGNLLLLPARQEMKKQSFVTAPKIVLAKGGHYAGAIGAAALHLK